MFPPSRDEIGPGRGRGASLKVSDWRKAALPSQPVRLLLGEETVEETRGQETEAEGGLRWINVAAALPPPLP